MVSTSALFIWLLGLLFLAFVEWLSTTSNFCSP